MENYSGADGRIGNLKPLPHGKVVVWQLQFRGGHGPVPNSNHGT